MKSKKYIFVIGIGRSGTTLLQGILDAHSEIKFLPETHFIKRYIVPELKKGAYHGSQISELVKELNQDPLLRQMKLDLSLEALRKSDSGIPITPSMFATLLDENSGNSTFVGDKDPMNVNYLKVIYRFFPESKILHIIRDPRDVIASRLKSDWNKRKSILFHTAEYKYGLNKSRKEGKSLFGSNYAEVKYEDLTNKPEQEIQRICEFIGVTFEDSMLTHDKSVGNLIRPEEMAWKSDVLKPITTGNQGKWKAELTSSQVKRIEIGLKKEMLSMSYSFEKKNNWFQSVLTQSILSIIQLVFKLKFN